ncbi:glycosyl transferase family 2 [Caldicellulosiruptor kronotskyensis 2002]|uniref:Glycosyl transferase family 2 n=1 Tax=Caldicellulosiruptor kronotskyensis (strain DSM 18902 / VKM B-2412 / 2002) TaxID=632348 RepID=E4SCA9_CALK2|nr:glycosyltransferase [Caldicellulosiruptor kronotskyensis]ADQ44964.1 glycosyl transferase family 2 [Caldicellulosiruptor kronotskyensis 2002]
MNDVVVLIPHYNNIEGLKKSIASINDDVDILIVDDGSFSKPTEEELRDLCVNPRVQIEIIYLKKNQGIEHALNAGLKTVYQKGYKFIARLDAGDECLPYRFSVQKQFLEYNPEIYLVGSWAEVVEENRVSYILKKPTDYKTIKKLIFVNNTFIHPAVMFRREVIDEVGFYPEKYKYAEDYAYFFKITKKFKCANIDKPLIRYTLGESNISWKYYKKQLKSRIKIIWDNKALNPYWFYGLIRNIFLLIVPKQFIEKLKKILFTLLTNKEYKKANF